MLALLTAGDADALEQKVAAYHRPLTPSVVGSRALAYSALEGTHLICKVDERMQVRFPADPMAEEGRLHVHGIASPHVVRVSDAQPTMAFPISGGGMADDPNGPNLPWPDDRHGIILTDADLLPDREVHVELASTAGTKWEMDLSIVMAPPMSVDEEVEELGRRALAAGVL